MHGATCTLAALALAAFVPAALSSGGRAGGGGGEGSCGAGANGAEQSSGLLQLPGAQVRSLESSAGLPGAAAGTWPAPPAPAPAPAPARGAAPAKGAVLSDDSALGQLRASAWAQLAVVPGLAVTVKDVPWYLIAIGAVLVVGLLVACCCWSQEEEEGTSPRSPGMEGETEAKQRRAMTRVRAAMRIGASVRGRQPSRQEAAQQRDATSAATSSRHLCPELVVPESGECLLKVPLITAGLLDSAEARLTISSEAEVPILLAAVGAAAAARGAQSGSSEGPLLTLMNPSGETTFASCRGTDRPRELQLIRPTGEPFGVLCAQSQQRGGEYVLRCGKDVSIHFSIADNRLQAMDNQNHQLALADPADSERCRHMRIGPQADAGLIVLCVLAIDIMEQRLNSP